MPIIYFGLGFSERHLPKPAIATLDTHFLDRPGLIRLLEGYYGLPQPTDRQDFLRIERFRQLLRADLSEHSDSYFAASYSADPLATAEEVLARRDELIEAGYRLGTEPSKDCPERIRCLHRIEQRLLLERSENDLPAGQADRLEELLAELDQAGHPALWIRVHEPFSLLATGTKRLLRKLADCGDFIQYLPSPSSVNPTSDLGRWQAVSSNTNSWLDELDFPASPDLAPPQSFVERWLSEGQLRPSSWDSRVSPSPTQALNEQNDLKADGSLIILRAGRETNLAAYLAKLLTLNPNWKPAVLLARKRQTLDNALRMEGLPSLGIPSASLARPTLQVLKLVSTFLWEPTDLRKLHEFLKLIVKPLDRNLGYRLAAALADSPGLYGEAWFTALNRFFDEELPKLAAKDSRVDPEEVRLQYDFWFRRTRYPITGRAPKSEVRKLFTFLANWVRTRPEEERDDTTGFLTLAAQAQRAVELIDRIDEEELTPLEVERIVRTVYEAAPARFQPEQLGSLPAAFHPAAIYGPVPELIWWDFVQEETDYFFSPWYRQELDYLHTHQIKLLKPETRNQRQIWSRSQPLLFTTERLILCLPERIEGTEYPAHPLLGELEALYGEELARITIDLDGEENTDFLNWPSPAFIDLPLQPLAGPEAFARIDKPERLHDRAYETPTALERFLYHPHQWVFRHGLLIRASRQLSLQLGTRLRGLLAHRFLERILAEDMPLADWTLEKLQAWIAEHELQLLRREGGLLLEYGSEPDRVQFRRQVQRAAWTLISALRDNGWIEVTAEIELSGHIVGTELRGRADLVAKRKDGSLALVDLKWRGRSRYTNLIRNREDLQLSLYARLLEEESANQVHTAYFLLSNARMLARNSQAFSGAEAIDSTADTKEIRQEILEKLAATYAWRREQLSEGRLEIRCSETIQSLEDAYQNLDYDRLLEMREDDAPFDDYRALIGLVR